MKNQALFTSKDRSKKLKCRLLQFLFGASRVNLDIIPSIHFSFRTPRTLTIFFKKRMRTNSSNLVVCYAPE